MRGAREGGDELREDLVSRRGRLLGVVAVVVFALAGTGGILAALRAGGPRADRRRALAEALTRDRTERTARDAGPRSEGFSQWPIAVPDGGWPDEPRDMEVMDEVPAGVLHQGSLDGEGDEDEAPASDVEVGAFFIDRFETTNEEYSRCVDAGVCRPPPQLPEDRFGSPRQPVVGVSWYDAVTYCRWAGKRLPTEAEWERAARGDDRRAYPWGDEPPTCERAAYTECDRHGPAEVGGRASGAGPFGTRDLAGNVWEWVQDWYAPRYYPAGPMRSPHGPSTGRRRVLRGGSWHYGPAHIRTGNRHRDDPEHRSPYYGIRCAYSRPSPPPGPASGAASTDAGLDAAPRGRGQEAGLPSGVYPPGSGDGGAAQTRHEP